MANLIKETNERRYAKIGVNLHAAKEKKRAEMEKVLDGDRFSQSISKITQNKKQLKAALNLRNKSSDRVLSLGIVSPDEILDPGKKQLEIDAERKLAEVSLSEATGFSVSNFERLSKEDIAFINDLDNDGTKDIVIRELFGKRVLKAYKKWMVDNKTRIISDKNTDARLKTKKSEEFVRLYVENYNEVLSGKGGTPMKELILGAGYSDKVNPWHVMRNPWVAAKIELYHRAVEKMNDYHYQQIQDRKLREKQRVQDLKDSMLSHYAANPEKLTNGKLGDQARMLKTLNELQVDPKDKGGAPPVAIQINSDIAKVAMSQDKDKKDHLDKSFN